MFTSSSCFIATILSPCFSIRLFNSSVFAASAEFNIYIISCFWLETVSVSLSTWPFNSFDLALEFSNFESVTFLMASNAISKFLARSGWLVTGFIDSSTKPFNFVDSAVRSVFTSFICLVYSSERALIISAKFLSCSSSRLDYLEVVSVNCFSTRPFNSFDFFSNLADSLTCVYVISCFKLFYFDSISFLKSSIAIS